MDREIIYIVQLSIYIEEKKIHVTHITNNLSPRIPRLNYICKPRYTPKYMGNQFLVSKESIDFVSFKKSIRGLFSLQPE